MRLKSLALAAVLAVAPFAAQAQTSTHKGLGDWSVVGAEVNTGKAFQDVQAGWPNVNFGYTMNMGKTSDIGFRFGLLYGIAGTTYTQFGLGLWAPIRFELRASSRLFSTSARMSSNWLQVCESATPSPARPAVRSDGCGNSAMWMLPASLA